GRQLTAKGVDLTLIASGGFPALPETFRVFRPFPNLRLYRGNLNKGLRYTFGMVIASFIVLRGRFDVVHWQLFYAFPPLEAAFAWFLRLTGQKTVLTIHDIQPWRAVSGRSDIFIRHIYRNVAQIIVHHSENKASLIQRYELDSDKIHVVPHGSYLDFTDDSRNGERTSKREGNTILFFGQIKAEKGLDVLIAALPTIVAEQPNTRLVIAGRPWRVDVEIYRAQVRALAISNHVVCLFRHIADEDMDDLFSQASVVVLPYREVTQSGVVLQAMSFGRPVVASDVGALGDTVRAAQCGVVVPPGDSAAVAQAILSLLRAPDVAEALGRNGKEAARANHDWGAIA